MNLAKRVLSRQRRLIAIAAFASSALLIVYATTSTSPRKHPPVAAACRSALPDALLPLPPADLANTADLARRFITAYGNHRYDEPTHAYLARLAPLVDDRLYQRLERAAQNTAVQAARQQDRSIATTEATITGTRDLQARSVIFLITARRHITQAGRRSQDTETFAVTLTKHGQDWHVAALALAGQGQEGEQPP